MPLQEVGGGILVAAPEGFDNGRQPLYEPPNAFGKLVGDRAGQVAAHLATRRLGAQQQRGQARNGGHGGVLMLFWELLG